MIVAVVGAFIDDAVDRFLDQPSPARQWVGREVYIDKSLQHRGAVIRRDPKRRYPALVGKLKQGRSAGPERVMPQPSGTGSSANGAEKSITDTLVDAPATSTLTRAGERVTPYATAAAARIIRAVIQYRRVLTLRRRVLALITRNPYSAQEAGVGVMYPPTAAAGLFARGQDGPAAAPAQDCRRFRHGCWQAPVRAAPRALPNRGSCFTAR